MKKMAPVLLGLAFFAIYLHHIAPSVTTGDSGEFMTAAGTLSLAHAPSYPMYSVATRFLSDLIPWGALPYRVNVVSALLSASAVGLLSVILLGAGTSLFGAVGISALVGWSHSFWMNALVTEVFPLNTVFAAGILMALMLARNNPRFFDVAAFLIGLGLGNHHILVAMGVLFIWAVWRSEVRLHVLKLVPRWALLFFIGFSIYAYLPLRSRAEPPLNWGQPTTVERFFRTLSRKDYGSFSLALGEAPKRDAKNTGHQIIRFAEQMSREISWPFFILALAGLVWGCLNKNFLAQLGLIGFLLTGPLFFLFANLPFSAQSEGIMGRFFILPSLFAVLGLTAFSVWRRGLSVMILAGVVWLGARGWVQAAAHRSNFLVWDYGQSMLRSLPSNAILFMDGGDDAFYSLAVLHEAMEQRPDVELHDRGGLVYRNVYGPDFRRLTKGEKEKRRVRIESAYLGVRPLYYSTMASAILPGVPFRFAGFLMEAGSQAAPRVEWDVLVLRSLYPLAVDDFRSRALAAFFPYMRGRMLLAQGRLAEGLRWWRRAASLGYDVDWVNSNLAYEYSHRGFQFLQAGDYAAAEMVYQEWLKFRPANFQAQSNLGVVFERQGRRDEALEQYRKTAALHPNEADPVYNQAVLLWRTGNWPAIEQLLNEALRRNPNHSGALSARQKIPGRKP